MKVNDGHLAQACDDEFVERQRMIATDPAPLLPLPGEVYSKFDNVKAIRAMAGS